MRKATPNKKCKQIITFSWKLGFGCHSGPNCWASFCAEGLENTQKRKCLKFLGRQCLKSVHWWRCSSGKEVHLGELQGEEKFSGDAWFYLLWVPNTSAFPFQHPVLYNCNEGTKTNCTSEWAPVYLDKAYLSILWKQLLILSISNMLGDKDMCLLRHYPSSSSDQPWPVLLKARLSLSKDLSKNLSKDYQCRCIRICGLIKLIKRFLPHCHCLHFNSNSI